MYGFAVLTAGSGVEAIKFAQRYQQLATPEADFSFLRIEGKAALRIQPVAHPQIDDVLFRFIVELHFSALLSVLRDYWGPDFSPARIKVSFGRPRDSRIFTDMFCCELDYHQADNLMHIDERWLDRASQFRNDVVHNEVVKLCDGLMSEMKNGIGISGRVREELLRRGLAPTSSGEVGLRCLPGKSSRREHWSPASWPT
jgi:hypothetical protein